MNRISNQDVIAVFESLGFKQHTIKGNVLFEKDGAYYRLSYINENMGYVIESADNYTSLRSNYGRNNYVGKAYEMLTKKHMTFPNAKPDVLRDEITTFFKDFRRSLPF